VGSAGGRFSYPVGRDQEITSTWHRAQDAPVLVTNSLANIRNTLRQRILGDDDISPYTCDDFVFADQTASILSQQSQYGE
jgi:hypothetical protein